MTSIHRTLDAAECATFRRWARSHYIPNTAIGATWHPVIIDECLLMNEALECGSCGGSHPPNFTGDCRDDANRYP